MYYYELLFIEYLMFKRCIDFVYQKKDDRSFLLLGFLVVMGFFISV